MQITTNKLNESYFQLDVSLDIGREISEYFTFEIPGAKHTPLYKQGRWDGKIRLYQLVKRLLPIGLLDELRKFCSERDYDLIIGPGLEPDTSITLDGVKRFMDGLGIDRRNPPINIRDYQYRAVYLALHHKRGILLSNTGSGKSLILYCICRYLQSIGKRVLIIVPTVGLTTQMKSDFADYSSGVTDWSADEHVHAISAGITKNSNKAITVSTYQSIYKLDEAWVNQFDAIIGDEAHKIVAKTIAGVYNNGTNVEYKLGCTGTLQEMKCNLLQMKAITGQVFDIATTKDLIDAGQLVPLDIKAITLKYPMEYGKALLKKDYDTEIKFITGLNKRNKFIAKLAKSCNGPTLVLFRFIEQGKSLLKHISDLCPDRTVHYIDGGVSSDVREEVRKGTNSLDVNDIIVSSLPTMSTGVNLPALSFIIFAHPTKSSITVLQSIGRGLRLFPGKQKCVLFDISDNISFKKTTNTSYDHFAHRAATYKNAGFDFTITEIAFDPEVTKL